MSDQAAGLRQWAADSGHAAPASTSASAAADEARRPATPLMVVGLPGQSAHQRERVTATLAHWAEAGWRWVGEPSDWQIVAVETTSPHLRLLASQQSRWALWVERDTEAFRRAYRLLKGLDKADGPRRLLVVHPPGLGRRGLLDNLRQAAAGLGIELLVLAK